MKNHLFLFWKKALHVGANDGMDQLQLMRLRSLNGLAVVGIFFTLVFVLIFIPLDVLSALEGLAIIPLLAFVLYLNWKGSFITSRIVFFYAMLVLIFVLALSDRKTGTEYLLIALACCSIILFERTAAIVSGLLSVFVVYFAYIIIDSRLTFIPDPKMPYSLLNNSLIFISSIWVASLLLIFRNTVLQYAVSLRTASNEVAAVNEELVASNEELTSLTENLDLAVKQKTDDLLDAVRALESVAYRTSHEIRGPLSRILGLSQLLEHGLIRMDEMKDVARKMIVSAQELNLATTDLTAFLNSREKTLNENVPSDI